MIGDNIGPLIWQGILAKARAFIASYWLIGVALVCMGLALYIAGNVE